MFILERVHKACRLFPVPVIYRVSLIINKYYIKPVKTIKYDAHKNLKLNKIYPFFVKVFYKLLYLFISQLFFYIIQNK